MKQDTWSLTRAIVLKTIVLYTDINQIRVEVVFCALDKVLMLHWNMNYFETAPRERNTPTPSHPHPSLILSGTFSRILDAALSRGVPHRAGPGRDPEGWGSVWSRLASHPCWLPPLLPELAWTVRQLPQTQDQRHRLTHKTVFLVQLIHEK